MKRTMVVIGCLIVGLQYKLWCEPDSLLSVIKLHRSISEQNAVNQKLKNVNLGLQAQIDDLKRGSAAIEEHARSELGFVQQGETFFQFVQRT